MWYKAGPVHSQGTSEQCLLPMLCWCAFTAKVRAGSGSTHRLEYALELMFCMPSQHHAIGLQTGCMVTVLAPVVEAARLPCVCPMALGYGLPPCNNNNNNKAAVHVLVTYADRATLG